MKEEKLEHTDYSQTIEEKIEVLRLKINEIINLFFEIFGGED